MVENLSLICLYVIYTGPTCSYLLIVVFFAYFGRGLTPTKAHGKSKAKAAKNCNFDPAVAARRGQFQVLLSDQNALAPHVQMYLLLRDPLVLIGDWLN